MVKLLRIAALPVVLFALFLQVSAQVIPDIPGRELMPLASVKAGMKGTARTVFSGSKAEEFGVEILGVVPGSIGPKQDLIIGKLSGANADRTLVFAGMSGSPVYIDGKLVGAISYSFPYAKEAICGITPIEQMVSIFAKPEDGSRLGGSSVSFTAKQLMSADWRSIVGNSRPASMSNVIAGTSNSGLNAVAGQTFAPIATPLAFGGISQATVDAFAPDLLRAGMVGITTAGSSGPTEFKTPTASTLVGGDSVVVQLARGDLSIAAAGTVTWRDGDKIYAFGHPYFGLGTSDLPMNESHVVTVVPNINNSFKLAVADATVGTMTQDRATGIYGVLGRQPKLIPVVANIKTSRGRSETIRFDSAVDDFLTPLVVNIGLLNSIQGSERQIGDMTIDVIGEIAIKGQSPVKIDRRYSGPQASAFAASSPAVAIAALLKSSFAGLEITDVKMDINMFEGSRNAVLDRIAVDNGQVRAGDTVNVTLSLRGEGGDITTEIVPVKIPEGAPIGNLSILIADGSAVQDASAVKQFSPRNAAELISTLNTVRRSDRLYAVLSQTAAGVIVGASELPNLPPSIISTINSDRSSGAAKATTARTISEQMITKGDLLIDGSQTVTVEVVR